MEDEVSQVVDPEPIQPLDPEPISHYERIHRSMQIATHQRKIQGPIPLIDVADILKQGWQPLMGHITLDPLITNQCLNDSPRAGLISPEDPDIAMSLIHVPFKSPTSAKEVTINSLQDAEIKLKGSCPFLDQLSFDGYVLAGGSVLEGVRQELRYIYGGPRYIDADFFLVTHETDIMKSNIRANQIFTKLMLEIDTICKTKMKDLFTTNIVETEHAVTIILKVKRNPKLDEPTEEALNYINGDGENLDPTLRHRIIDHMTKMAKLIQDRRYYTIQIVKRAYSSKCQILRGFDLWPSQILYDGQRFLCTEACRTSLLLNVIPMDVSRASLNWAERLIKYAGAKQFYLVALGLNKELAKVRLTPIKAASSGNKSYKLTVSNSIYFPCGFSLAPTLSENQGNAPVLHEFGIYLTKKESDFTPAIHSDSHIHGTKLMDDVSRADTYADDFEMPGSDFSPNSAGQCISDYADNYIEELALHKPSGLATLNLKRYIAGNKKLLLVGHDIKDYVTNPQGTDIVNTFQRLVSNPSFLNIETMRFMFGDLVGEALDSMIERDANDYRKVIAQRLKPIVAGMTEIFELLKTRSWKVCDPSAQNYGAFNPVNLTARNFYGCLGRPIPGDHIPFNFNRNIAVPGECLYNGYHCTLMWPQKATIICAKIRQQNLEANPSCRETDLSDLVYLDKNLWKKIFFCLDDMLVEEYLKSVTP